MTECTNSCEIDIKTFIVAVGLQGRACNQREPGRSSSGCAMVLSVCDQTVQRTCFVIEHHPFSVAINGHTKTYFLKRSVPVRGQFTFFLCWSFKSIFYCITFFVRPQRGIIVECRLFQRKYICVLKVVILFVGQKHKLCQYQIHHTIRNCGHKLRTKIGWPIVY